jgi:hypothetical protein
MNQHPHSHVRQPLNGFSLTESAMSKVLPPLAACTAALLLTAAPAAAETLSGDALRKLVTGRTVYLAAPLGGEMPLRYSPNGTVDGNGQAVGLGRFFAARESGRWFMRGDQLCQQFPTWYNGERLCFTVQDLGGGRIRWIRDNGERGIARIGN